MLTEPLMGEPPASAPPYGAATAGSDPEAGASSSAARARDDEDHGSAAVDECSAACGECVVELAVRGPAFALANCLVAYYGVLEVLSGYAHVTAIVTIVKISTLTEYLKAWEWFTLLLTALVGVFALAVSELCYASFVTLVARAVEAFSGTRARSARGGEGGEGAEADHGGGACCGGGDGDDDDPTTGEAARQLVCGGRCAALDCALGGLFALLAALLYVNLLVGVGAISIAFVAYVLCRLFEYACEDGGITEVESILSELSYLEDVLDIPWYDDAEELTSSLATDCNDYVEIRHDILMMIFGSLVVFCAELNLLLFIVDSWRKVRSRRRYEEGKES